MGSAPIWGEVLWEQVTKRTFPPCPHSPWIFPSPQQLPYLRSVNIGSLKSSRNKSSCNEEQHSKNISVRRKRRAEFGNVQYKKSRVWECSVQSAGFTQNSLLLPSQTLVRKPNPSLKSSSSRAQLSHGFSNHHSQCSHHNQERINPLLQMFPVLDSPSNAEKEQEAAKGEDNEGQGHGFLAADAVDDPQGHQHSWGKRAGHPRELSKEGLQLI